MNSFSGISNRAPSRPYLRSG